MSIFNFLYRFILYIHIYIYIYLRPSKIIRALKIIISLCVSVFTSAWVCFWMCPFILCPFIFVWVSTDLGYPSTLFGCYMGKGWEENGHINWQLWPSFVNFIEININWYLKGKIDNLNLFKISETNPLSSPSKFPQFGRIKSAEFWGWDSPPNPLNPSIFPSKNYSNKVH